MAVSGLALDLLMYEATLIMLLEVCKIPSAYQAFPYEKSDEAVKAIRSALQRAPGNHIGPWIRQIDEWENCREQRRGYTQ